MHRRELLQLLGSALGASAVGCSPGVRRTTATDSTDGPRHLGPLGVQLYTVRTEMERSVETTLERVARTGYREVEFAGYFGHAPARIRAILDANGLVAPSSHVDVEAVRDRLGDTLDAAGAVGHHYIVVPSLPEEMRRTPDDLKRTAELFNRAAVDAQQRGVHLAYHNHDTEFVPVDGQLPYDVLLGETDPSLVTFELDLYWATKAGQDPVAWFASHPGRFPLLHVKDSAGPPEHRMVDVGSGTIDWCRILAQRTAAGVRHLFVEHDQPAEPFASIANSYAYLSKLTF